MSLDLAKQFARLDPLAFATACNRRFEIANHLKLIGRKLEDLEKRKIKRLMVFMPPRHGKSFLISEYFPAWYLGKNPNHQIIATSYNQELAADFGRKVRNLIMSDVYQMIFPSVFISEDSSANKRFHLNQGGVYICAGANGTITGRGGDLVIIDDIHKGREDVENQEQRTKVQRWYASTLFPRLMPDAAIVLVQTRWHPDDLPGWLLSQSSEPWDVLALPALSESGDALWPERFNRESLLRIKSTIGSHDFESLFQQRPSLLEGSLIKRDWIKFYKVLPDRIEHKIQSWDLSFKGEINNDYVAGHVWGRSGGSAYLINRLKQRMDFPATLQAIRSMSNRHKDAAPILVEEAANGAALIATLANEIPGIIGVKADRSKEARVHAVAPYFEAGNIYLPDPSIDPTIYDFVEELVNFPAVKNDDEVDACSQALNRLFVHAAGNWDDTLLIDQPMMGAELAGDDPW